VATSVEVRKVAIRLEVTVHQSEASFIHLL